MKGYRFLGVGGNQSAQGNLPRRVWNRQTKFTYNHWLAALVKVKCSSTNQPASPLEQCAIPIQNRIGPTKSPGPAGAQTGDPLHRKRELYQCATLLHVVMGNYLQIISMSVMPFCRGWAVYPFPIPVSPELRFVFSWVLSSLSSPAVLPLHWLSYI